MSVKDARSAARKVLASLDDSRAPLLRKAKPQQMDLKSQLCDLGEEIKGVKGMLGEVMATVKPEQVENTITLSEICDRLDRKYFSNKSASTEKTYRNYLNSVLLPEWGDIPTESITNEDLADWYHNHVGVNGGRPTQPFKILMSILKLAKKRKLIARVPDPEISDTYRTERGEALRHKEITQIERHLERKVEVDGEPRDWALLVCANNGERSEALCSLHTDEIDWKTGYATKRRKGPNGGKVEAIPYTDHCMSLLKKIRPKGGGYLFPHPYLPNQHISGQSLRRYFQAMCARLGIKLPNGKEPVVHSLRHTYFTELWRIGVPIAQISKLAGHSSIQTTERYLHGDKKLAQKEANRLKGPRTRRRVKASG